MRIPRLYLDAPYQTGQTLSLDKAQAHYVLTVLRLKNARPIEIFDGQGQQAQATLEITSRRTADLHIHSIDTPITESPLNTVLCQAISKGDHMDYTIQKAVELGISAIQPLYTQHCDIKPDDAKQQKRLEHWQTIAIHACEQSGRNTLPPIFAPQTFTEWLNSTPNKAGLVLDPYAEHSIKTLPSSLVNESIQILVGPEGGLNETEVQQAQQAGMTAIKLGPRILRTETAGMTLLAALQTLWGDFQ